MGVDGPDPRRAFVDRSSPSFVHDGFKSESGIKETQKLRPKIGPILLYGPWAGPD